MDQLTFLTAMSESQSRQIIALQEENVGLRAGNRTLTAINENLTTRIVDHLESRYSAPSGTIAFNEPIAHGPTVPEHPVTGWTSVTVHPLPPRPTRPPISRDDDGELNPSQEPWTLGEARERNPRKNQSRDFDTRTFLYHSEFEAFKAKDDEAIRVNCYAWFVQLRLDKHLPIGGWAKLDPAAKLGFISFICLLHPCLRRCEDHWKADAVGHKFYNSWSDAEGQQRRRDKLCRVKLEAADGAGAEEQEETQVVGAGSGIVEATTEQPTPKMTTKRGRSASFASSSGPTKHPAKRAHLPIEAADVPQTGARGAESDPPAASLQAAIGKNTPPIITAPPMRSAIGLSFGFAPAPFATLAAPELDLPSMSLGESFPSQPAPSTGKAASKDIVQLLSAEVSTSNSEHNTPLLSAIPAPIAAAAEAGPSGSASSAPIAEGAGKTYSGRLSVSGMYRLYLDEKHKDWNDKTITKLWLDAKTDPALLEMMEERFRKAKVAKDLAKAADTRVKPGKAAKATKATKEKVGGGSMDKP